MTEMQDELMQTGIFNERDRLKDSFGDEISYKKYKKSKA
jgi:hypothetical protein